MGATVTYKKLAAAFAGADRGAQTAAASPHWN